MQTTSQRKKEEEEEQDDKEQDDDEEQLRQARAFDDYKDGMSFLCITDCYSITEIVICLPEFKLL